MKDNVLVSVVVAIYNVADYLDKCIKSIVNQSYHNIQIILVDDGSSDNSFDICSMWEKIDNRIILIHQENKGVSAARNVGISKAKGEYISFVDGDDYLDKDAIEKMLLAIGDNDILIADYYVDNKKTIKKESFLSIDSRVFFEYDEKIELIKNCFIRTNISNQHSITLIGVPWAKLYRLSLINNNRLCFDEKLKKMQDAIFNFDAFYFAKSIAYEKSLNVYHYVQNSSSITHAANNDYKKMIDSFMIAFKEKIDFYHIKEFNDVYNAKIFLLALSSIKFIYILEKTHYSLFQRIDGTKRVLKNLSFSDNNFFSYLNTFQKLAYIMYKLKMFSLIYLFCWLYYIYQRYKHA